jgi:hypothetical protein
MTAREQELYRHRENVRAALAAYRRQLQTELELEDGKLPLAQLSMAATLSQVESAARVLWMDDFDRIALRKKPTAPK